MLKTCNASKKGDIMSYCLGEPVVRYNHSQYQFAQKVSEKNPYDYTVNNFTAQKSDVLTVAHINKTYDATPTEKLNIHYALTC